MIGAGSAIVIGFIGGLVYIASSRILIKLRVDDPLDASAVHGFCGLWGVISVGFFATENNIKAAYSPYMASLNRGALIGNQCGGALIIAAWTIITSGLMFAVAKNTVGLRTEEGMGKGLDSEDFGSAAYEVESPTPTCRHIVELQNRRSSII